MTKLSDLKVGDKFRFVNEDEQFEVTDIRTRSDGNQEVNFWSDKSGFGSLFSHCVNAVELITDPQYRPYSDLRVILGQPVKSKQHEERGIVTWAGADFVLIGPMDRFKISNTELLEHYTHLDGTPCGELVE